MNIPDLLFSTQGRINRGKWWLGVLCVVGTVLVISLVLWSIFHTGLFYTFSGRLMVFILTVFALFASYCINAKRFHDRNKSSVFAQVALILNGIKAVLDLVGLTGDPWGTNTADTLFQLATMGVGIWYFVELGCLRGTAGPNEYGPDPLAYDPYSTQPTA
jgi:uncharacterized membrane protein YhaH (DUF805 family)